jgi:hypothetical protein
MKLGFCKQYNVYTFIPALSIEKRVQGKINCKIQKFYNREFFKWTFMSFVKKRALKVVGADVVGKMTNVR